MGNDRLRNTKIPSFLKKKNSIGFRQDRDKEHGFLDMGGNQDIRERKGRNMGKCRIGFYLGFRTSLFYYGSRKIKVLVLQCLKIPVCITAFFFSRVSVQVRLFPSLFFGFFCIFPFCLAQVIF